MSDNDSKTNLQESEDEVLGGCPITASMDWLKKVFTKIPGLGSSKNEPVSGEAAS